MASFSDGHRWKMTLTDREEEEVEVSSIDLPPHGEL
jgi:hypothetical protein